MSKSTKWFLAILSILALFGLGFALLFYSFFKSVGDGSTKEIVTIGRGDKIGVVELMGVIMSSEDVVRQLKKYRDDSGIKGILLRVDSPGGAVVPSQEMYEEVKKAREKKPVVVSMGSVAASGGYYVAMGATRIVANRGTLTGSIGVIGEFLQLQEAMGKLGIDVKTIKSGKLKDAGSYARKMNEMDEKYFQGLMDDVHRQFIAVVEKEREMDRAAVVEVADGRVFTGEQALKLGLVDTLGTYEEALAIAAELSGIDGEPSVVKERYRRSFMDRMLGDVGESLSDLKQTILNKPFISYRFTGPY